MSDGYPWRPRAPRATGVSRRRACDATFVHVWVSPLQGGPLFGWGVGVLHPIVSVVRRRGRPAGVAVSSCTAWRGTASQGGTESFVFGCLRLPALLLGVWVRNPLPPSRAFVRYRLLCSVVTLRPTVLSIPADFPLVFAATPSSSLSLYMLFILTPFLLPPPPLLPLNYTRTLPLTSTPLLWSPVLHPPVSFPPSPPPPNYHDAPALAGRALDCRGFGARRRCSPGCPFYRLSAYRARSPGYLRGRPPKRFPRIQFPRHGRWPTAKSAGVPKRWSLTAPPRLTAKG